MTTPLVRAAHLAKAAGLVEEAARHAVLGGADPLDVEDLKWVATRLRNQAEQTSPTQNGPNHADR